MGKREKGQRKAHEGAPSEKGKVGGGDVKLGVENLHKKHRARWGKKEGRTIKSILTLLV